MNHNSASQARIEITYHDYNRIQAILFKQNLPMIDDILDQDPTILEDLEKINIEKEHERIGAEDRKGMLV